MATEIERRYGPRGLHATAVHPGVIMTGLSRHVPAEISEAFMADDDKRNSVKSLAQGTATTVWAAVGKAWATEGGKYLANCAVPTPAPHTETMAAEYHAAWAYDADKAARLWEDSRKLVGLEA